MERKIGEIFEYEGKKLKVVETKITKCEDCYFFDNHACMKNYQVAGKCISRKRTDYKPVIFVEVKDEQPHEQAEQPQKLNLCEVLKHCPEGEPFWSPMLGDVKFYDIGQSVVIVRVEMENGETWVINADGTITIGGVTSQEIMLYPSREQRDWTKVKYEPKKELPKTWEEFCKQNPIRETEYFFGDCCNIMTLGKDAGTRCETRDRNILPSKQAAEAHLALMQLHQLRDAWRERWLPDWNDNKQVKYVILRNRNEYEIRLYNKTSHFLSFQHEERADEFLECFRDLIEKAGDLI